MQINWRVRLKSKEFWVTIIPAILLFVQSIAALFGFEIDLGDIGNKLLVVVEALFVVLAMLGIVVDHTTKGISDSDKAMTYTEPN